MSLLSLLFLSGLTACATPVKLAGKVAWSAVELGAGLAWKIAAGLGKFGTRETVNALDLTADASRKIAAAREAKLLVETYWHYLQGGALAAAYDLFSDSLKHDMSRTEFYKYARERAGGVRDFQVMEGTVRQFHVEVPARILVQAEKEKAEVTVRTYVSQLKKGGWRITGWEAKGN